MQEPGNTPPPVSSAEITDDVFERIHNTPCMSADYSLLRAYHATLTNPEIRDRYLAWMERNDLMFRTAMRVVYREGTGADLYKSLALIFAREYHQLLHSKPGGPHAG